MNDLLMPHLLDILSRPASQELILAGGFGMRIKQAHLRESGARTLINKMPTARATQDLDFFLRMEIFVQTERGKAVREVLDELSYTEHTPKWQFSKALRAEATAGEKIMVDLLARSPVSGEPVDVRNHRVGSRSGISLHGHETPEAFAVEDSPMQIPVRGALSTGVEIEASVFVPHPYSWINMKVKAAHDWLLMKQGKLEKKPFREKHAFDVYLLTAMLQELELEESEQMAQRYSLNPLAIEIGENAKTLFGARNSLGFREAEQLANSDLDYDTFREGLWGVLGLN